MNGAENLQDYDCPICDRKATPGVYHRCPPRTLAGIDAADTAAWNRDGRPDDAALFGRPGFHARLAQGFRLLRRAEVEW